MYHHFSGSMPRSDVHCQPGGLRRAGSTMLLLLGQRRATIPDPVLTAAFRFTSNPAVVKSFTEVKTSILTKLEGIVLYICRDNLLKNKINLW